MRGVARQLEEEQVLFMFCIILLCFYLIFFVLLIFVIFVTFNYTYLRANIFLFYFNAFHVFFIYLCFFVLLNYVECYFYHTHQLYLLCTLQLLGGALFKMFFFLLFELFERFARFLKILNIP